MQPALRAASGPAMPALRCTEALRDVRISCPAVARPGRRRPQALRSHFPRLRGRLLWAQWMLSGCLGAAQPTSRKRIRTQAWRSRRTWLHLLGMSQPSGSWFAKRRQQHARAAPSCAALHLKSSGQSAGTVSDELLHALPAPGGSFLGAICMSGLGDGRLSLRGLGSSLSRLAVCSQPF